MPLTKSGKKVMSNMMNQYGAKKGKSVFYASVNAKKGGSKKWHGGRTGNGDLGYHHTPQEMIKQHNKMRKGKPMGMMGS